MTHARILEFSHPAPVGRATAPTSTPAAPVAPARRAPAGPVATIVSDRPDTPHSRAPRFLVVTGEALTAVLIIAGGVFAYGFLPFA